MTRQKLTPRELAIMEIVWDRGDATVRDVHEALSRRRKTEPATHVLEGGPFRVPARGGGRS